MALDSVTREQTKKCFEKHIMKKRWKIWHYT